MKSKIISIDYENICLNCKEKGFYFGFSFKTIEFQGIPVLDLPARYLNGPAITLEYNQQPLMIYSMMNSHQAGSVPTEPVFTMMNSKYGESHTKFTYQYLMQNNLAFRRPKSELMVDEPKLLFYVDNLHYASKPYILMYFGIRNLTGIPIKNLNFYQFYDFDIYGKEGYSKDIAKYDKIQQIIYQYNANFGLEKGLIAGICSSKSLSPNYYEGNNSTDIPISLERVNLRNLSDYGPADCAIALQWNLGKLDPNELRIIPITMVINFGIDNFISTCQLARDQLEKQILIIKRGMSESGRQEIDPKLKEMSFSVTQWCKDSH